MILDREAGAGDAQRVPSTPVVRQVKALATSVCVLRVCRIAEVSECPRVQSVLRANSARHVGS